MKLRFCEVCLFRFVFFSSNYIQIVPFCDFNNNNIRKLVHMALELGLFNKQVKISLYFKDIYFFNLTSTVTTFSLF